MNQLCNSEKAALQVIQEAVRVLAVWVDSKLKDKLPDINSNEDVTKKAVENAKNLLSWNSNKEPEALRLLFDYIDLSKDEQEKRENKVQQHYYRPSFIADSDPEIPYPVTKKPQSGDFQNLKDEIKKVLDTLDDNRDLSNLSLLTLILEKYGSFISFGDEDVALIDLARSTAAIAAALVSNPDANQLTLVAGDLSGIQNFIYTISSDGALKSLRARSFYLELVTEEIVQQIIEELKLPRTNVIYAGGGNLYILAPGIDSVKQSIINIRQQFNQWLLNEFQGKVFLALDCLEFPTKDITTEKFADHWSELTSKRLAKHKLRKFAENIHEFIQERDSHELCRVCHRDDLKPEQLKPLNNEELSSVLACETCKNMFELGENLLKLGTIVRSSSNNWNDEKKPKLSFELPATNERSAIKVYYYSFDSIKPIVNNPETVFLINNWTVENYKLRYFSNPVPLLLGNYGKKTTKPEEKGFMRAEEMAEKAKGIKRVGYLRMDVDHLGKIFAKGLGEKKTLPRIAGLSRQMSYFFKVYLSSLAKYRTINHNIKQLNPHDTRLHLLFIYAGGDDLFISGAWNEVVEFAFDIYQSFRAYTGYNPDITLSGGISIEDVKFPLYEAADSSGDAEKAAKGNGRDSLGLFGQVFKWDEWLGHPDNTKFDEVNETYKYQETKPKLLGIFPFVTRLEQQNIGIDYARSFVRNLLITAQIQEECVKKFKDNQTDKEALDTRYYLHLPKIAYTLARLPKNVLDDVDFRTSLKSPYNAPYFRAIATWIELLNRAS